MTSGTERWTLIAGDFTPLGGMDRANHALAMGLARRGRQVRLVTHQAWEDVARLPNVRVRRVFRPFGSHLLGAPLLAAAGRGAVSAGRTDRVVANGGNAICPDVTWIHYLHAAYLTSGGSAAGRIVSGYYRRRERAAITRARYIVCNSRRTASDVAAAYGVREDRLRIVYYGSDAHVFSPADDASRTAARRRLGWPVDEPVAVFVGALGDRRKGFDRLFEAWRLLSADPGWDLSLAVAGEGAELSSWQRRAAETGIRRIRFLGFRRDIHDVIGASDVMVHPARYEAYGLGVHEAICRGVPAIVSAAAGVVERFTGDLRELVLDDAGNAADIVERLLAWRAGCDRYARAALACGEELRAYTWDDMAGDFVRAVA